MLTTADAETRELVVLHDHDRGLYWLDGPWPEQCRMALSLLLADDGSWVRFRGEMVEMRFANARAIYEPVAWDFEEESLVTLEFRYADCG